MKYLRNESLKKHTSFRIGGPADYLCVPKTLEDLKAALQFAKKRKLTVALLGAGTNLLALDRGFRGLVIKLAGGLKEIEVLGRKVRVGSGVYLSQLINHLAKSGLSGLEFLAGVPGTVGGAVVMNAGAWGKEIKGLIRKVKGLNKQGKEVEFSPKQLGFEYRKSNLQDGKIIVTEVELNLKKKRFSLIRKRIKEFLERRKKNQPLGTANAGSIFKNPRRGAPAGKLLEEVGAKGLRIGDAVVSRKHANFILNLGEAGARDVIKLMTRLQKAVKDKFKILLEPELKIMVKSSL